MAANNFSETSVIFCQSTDLRTHLTKPGTFSTPLIYRTIIFPVVLYGFETWSLTLREERRLRVFENNVLRGIFGGKRDEVTGEWRKLHNEELNDLYCSTIIVRVIKSRRMRWVGHVARMGRGELYTGFCGET
jgi:hypothetical protein